MKQFILSICAALLLFSCNKNNDNPYSHDEGIRISAYKNATTDVQIGYDDQNRVKSIVYTTLTSYPGPIVIPGNTYSTIELDYDWIRPVMAKAEHTSPGLGYTLYDTTQLNWAIGGTMLESGNNHTKTTWHTDGSGRLAGYTTTNPLKTEEVRWSYDKNGDVIPPVRESAGPDYKSTITYTSHGNPFRNAKTGLLAFVFVKRSEEDMIRYLSAHLPAEWEIFNTVYLQTPGAASKIETLQVIRYSYGFDQSGLLSSITETRKSYTTTNGQPTGITETVFSYQVSCFRVK